MESIEGHEWLDEIFHKVKKEQNFYQRVFKGIDMSRNHLNEVEQKQKEQKNFILNEYDCILLDYFIGINLYSKKIKYAEMK